MSLIAYPERFRERALFTLREAEEITGVPVSTFRKLCKEGILNPVTGFGRVWRITREDLNKVLSHRLRRQV